MTVEIPPELERQIEAVAERQHTSKEEVVLTAVRRTFGLREKPWNREDARKALAELFQLNAPTGDIEQMLAETQAGRLENLP